MDTQMLEKLTKQIFSTKLCEASIAMVDAAEFDFELDEFQTAIQMAKAAKSASADLAGFVGLAKCESPIEKIIFTSIYTNASEFFEVYVATSKEDAEIITTDSRRDYVLIEPQWHWTAFRCDFRISTFRFWDNRKASVIVECDGHEFHEKTKEQAQRDKSRDRQFLLAGMSVLRFTGSEIWKNPTVCTAQIFAALGIPQCIDHKAEVGL